MRSPRPLKVFSADMGFVRAVVAVPSRKAALEAWGVRDDLFARGTAREVQDEALAEEARAQPGEVLRKPIAAPSGFVEAAKPARAKPGGKQAAGAKPTASSKPKPSRKPLEAAEAKLKEKEAARRAHLEALEDEQAALDAKRDRIQSEGADAVQEAKSKRDRAKAAYDQALKTWSIG